MDDASVGAQLRAAREAAGLSLAALARRVPFSKSALGHYETGVRPPTPEVVEWYERAIGAELDPVTSVVSLGRADVDRRQLLRGVVYAAALSALPLSAASASERLRASGAGRRVGMADVASVHAVTDAFQKIDESRGAIGRTAIAEFLATDVADLLRSDFRSEAVRTAAFSAAAEVAYLAGFKAHDGGLDGLAQRYYMAALRLAEESGDDTHAAWVLRILALQGTDLGERRYSVRLADRALARVDGAGADEMALFQVALARCHAETGDERGAADALRSAERAIDSSEAPADLPRWAAMWCPSRTAILNQAAKAFEAIGEMGEAERHYGHALSMWDRQAHARPYALTATDVGAARWAMGDESGAADVWRTAIPVLRTVESKRTDQALIQIRSQAPELVGA